MRWLRLFLLALVSVYPLYWTAQFVLFFLPAALRSATFRLPLQVVDISFLHATALAGTPTSLSFGVEPLIFAVLFCTLILLFRGDQFLSGGLAIVILGQSVLLPVPYEMRITDRMDLTNLFVLLVPATLIFVGLRRVLVRFGGRSFVDRLALLSLLAVLPEVLLWLIFDLRDPSLGSKFLLALLVPAYVGSLMAAALPLGPSEKRAVALREGVSFVEIVASVAVAASLLAAIGLAAKSSERRHEVAGHWSPR